MTRTLKSLEAFSTYFKSEAEIGDVVTVVYNDGSRLQDVKVTETGYDSQVKFKNDTIGIVWTSVKSMEVPDLEKDRFLDFEEGWYRLKEGRPELVFRFYEGEWTMHGLHGHEYQVYAGSRFAREITSGGVEKL